MAFSTPTDIIKAAMGIIGSIAIDETPSASEMNLGLKTLILMLELWSARGLMVRGTTQENFPLVAGQAAYTIGIGGNFNTSKPVAILSAFIRDANLIDTGLDIITQEEYDGMGDKAVSQARPMALCYDPGYAQQAVQTGTVRFYYTPDNSTAYTVFMQEQKQLNDFSTLTDTVTFEPKYGEAMAYNLALRLWRYYHEEQATIPGDILQLADRALCVIEKTNAVQYHAPMEVPGRKGVYNVYVDEMN